MTDDELQQQLKDAVSQVRKANPGWNFQRAWTHLQQTKPELFEGEDYHTQQGQASATGSVPAYRYTEPMSSARTLPSKPLRELLGAPSKVEAKKPKSEDDGELMLVMAGGQVVDIELT